MVPFTSSAWVGAVVPIPTLPFAFIRRLSDQVADAFLRAIANEDPVSDKACIFIP